MRVVFKPVLVVTFLISLTHTSEVRTKVAVVTGANKGIGYEIVKGLCEKYSGHVYLTSRDEERGKQAVNKLKRLRLNAYYHQLDVTDPVSIQRFADYINATEGGIDLLINNAGVANFNDRTTPYATQIDNLMNINYFGLLQVSDGLSPLLRRNARVVNLSSAVGLLSRITSNTLRSQLGSRTLTITKLNSLMNQYISSAKQNKHAQEGWPAAHDSPYVVSKIGVSALTYIQQRAFDTEPEKRDVSVNCVHPGYVDTDLTDHQGYLSPEEGAAAPLYLALENHNLKGQFLNNNKRVVDWYRQ